MRTFFYDDNKKVKFQAEGEINGILINPKEPPKFWNTANEARPKSHLKFNGLPYIKSELSDSPEAVEGKIYHVQCLDGGAWDRPTVWGFFYTLQGAEECAKNGPKWRREK